MDETLSRKAGIECFSVEAESAWQLLRWIHYEMPDAEFAMLRADVEPRITSGANMPPMELVDETNRLAAAYFIHLDGKVATLGGLRARRGCESLAGRLLDEYQSRLQAQGVAQIQALVDVSNVATKMAMLHSGFRQVTTVRHLLFDLVTMQPIRGSWDSRFELRAASEFSRGDVDKLVAQTFEGTLDCPHLDGLRSSSEVVAGFLEAKAWDRELPWKVLCEGSKLVGCAFVNPHPRNIFELAYVGLTPAVRGRGLGRKLVQATIDDCRKRGGHYLATAVDTQNWPACEIYRSLYFTELRELGVWLPKSAQRQQAVA